MRSQSQRARATGRGGAWSSARSVRSVGSRLRWLIAGTFLCMLFGRCHAVAWSREGVLIHEERNEERAMDFDIVVDEVNPCVFDEFSIQWRSLLIHRRQELGRVNLVVRLHSDPDESYLTPLIADLPVPFREGSFGCVDASDLLCVPEIQGVTLSTDSTEVTVAFQAPVLPFPVQDKSQIEALLAISPALQHEAFGQWVTAQKLVLVLHRDDSAMLVDAFQSQQPVSIKLQSNLLHTSSQVPADHLRGNITFRALAHGVRYETFVFDKLAARRASPVVAFTVKQCDAHFLPPTATGDVRPARSSTLSSGVRPSLLYSMKGLLAVSDKTQVVLDHASVRAVESSSWTINMWILLLEAPTGAHRTLFFKGRDTFTDSFHQERTISAWLMPQSNHVHLQVSTVQSDVVQITSVHEIPMNSWTMLTVVLINNSCAHVVAANGSCIYSHPACVPAVVDTCARREMIYSESAVAPDKVSLYLNAALDVEGTLMHRLKGNRMPLRMLHDGTHRGPRGFVHTLTVYAGDLSRDVLSQLYHGELSSALQASLRSLDVAVGLAAYSHSPILPFVDQYAASLRTSPSTADMSVPGSAALEAYSKQGLHRVDVSAFAARNVSGNSLFRQMQALFATTSDSTIFTTNEAVHVPRRKAPANPFQSSSRSTRLSSAAVLPTLHARMERALADCADASIRMNLYYYAALEGDINALVKYGKMLLFGFEDFDMSCGYEFQDSGDEVSSATVGALSRMETESKTEMRVNMSRTAWERKLLGSDIASHADEKCAELDVDDDEYVVAAVPPSAASTMEPFWDATFMDTHKASLSFAYAFAQGAVAAAMPLTHLMSARMVHALEQYPTTTSLILTRPIDEEDMVEVRVQHHPRAAMEVLVPRKGDTIDEHRFRDTVRGIQRYLTSRAERDVVTGTDVSDSVSLDVHDLMDVLQPMDRHPVQSTRAGVLELGIVYLAAMRGDMEAHVFLAHRYESGQFRDVPRCLETSGVYSAPPVQVASDLFHLRGAQPIVESDRINDDTVREIAKGNEGEDDEYIAYQRKRAKEGDAEAMVNMGNLHYYGARGLARDHGQALNYYSQAAAVGDPSAQCGAANMLLKGEGAARDVPQSLALYSQAARSHLSTQALNGLGYIYFNGVVDASDPTRPIVLVEQNYTRAFHYFLWAADPKAHLESIFLDSAVGGTSSNDWAAYKQSQLQGYVARVDGDAHFNVAYCYEHGLGTPRDLQQALRFYNKAATQAGHFSSIKTMGDFFLTGGLPSVWRSETMLTDVCVPERGAVAADDVIAHGTRSPRGEVCLARNASTAKEYLRPSRDMGPWVQALRRGLDLFLAARRGGGRVYSSPVLATTAAKGQLGLSLLSRLASYAYKLLARLISGQGEAESLGAHRSSVTLKAINCYLHAARLGYEVALSNAIFLIRSTFATRIRSLSRTPAHSQVHGHADPANDAIDGIDSPHAPPRALPRLLLAMHATHWHVFQQPLAAHALAQCFFGLVQCDLPDRARSHRLYRLGLLYLDKAIYSHTPVMVSVLQLGMMHHFNLSLGQDLDQRGALPLYSMGTDAEALRVKKAQYYYRKARVLVDASAAVGDVPWDWILDTLLFSLEHRDNWLFRPLHWALEQVVRCVWDWELGR